MRSEFGRKSAGVLDCEIERICDRMLALFSFRSDPSTYVLWLLAFL